MRKDIFNFNKKGIDKWSKSLTKQLKKSNIKSWYNEPIKSKNSKEK